MLTQISNKPNTEYMLEKGGRLALNGVLPALDWIIASFTSQRIFLEFSAHGARRSPAGGGVITAGKLDAVNSS